MEMTIMVLEVVVVVRWGGGAWNKGDNKNLLIWNNECDKIDVLQLLLLLLSYYQVIIYTSTGNIATYLLIQNLARLLFVQPSLQRELI